MLRKTLLLHIALLSMLNTYPAEQLDLPARTGNGAEQLTEQIRDLLERYDHSPEETDKTNARLKDLLAQSTPAMVNATGRSAFTPLFTATCRYLESETEEGMTKWYNRIQWLLDAGADPNAPTRSFPSVSLYECGGGKFSPDLDSPWFKLICHHDPILNTPLDCIKHRRLEKLFLTRYPPNHTSTRCIRDDSLAQLVRQRAEIHSAARSRTQLAAAHICLARLKNQVLTHKICQLAFSEKSDCRDTAAVWQNFMQPRSAFSQGAFISRLQELSAPQRHSHKWTTWLPFKNYWWQPLCTIKNGLCYTASSFWTYQVGPRIHALCVGIMLWCCRRP